MVQRGGSGRLRPTVGATRWGLLSASAFLVMLVLLSASTHADAALNSVPDDGYVANGRVQAIVRSGSAVYLAGDFTRVGPRTGSMVALAQSSGAVVAGFPEFAGDTKAVVSDGSGGWFVGGAFTSVGGTPRARLVHLLGDGSVDGSFTPAPNGTVNALARVGSTLYVGGTFTSIGGASRNALAAVDAGSGTATGWAPSVPSGAVTALAASGSTVYVGGTFTSIAGQSRRGLAAIDASTAAASSWDPQVAGRVLFGNVRFAAEINDLELTGSTLYVAGDLEVVGNTPRTGVAAIDTSSGAATSWNPVVATGGSDAPRVDALTVSGDDVYLGGRFASVSGLPRANLAVVSASSGTTGGLTPDPNGGVTALAVDGSTLFAGGYFSKVGGNDRAGLAAISTATGAVSTWDPSPNRAPLALAAGGSNVLVAGTFTSVGGVARGGLAAVSAATGQPTSWAPTYSGCCVFALAASGPTIYIGGSFDTISGQPRKSLAAVDASTGAITSWAPNLGGAFGPAQVNTIEILGRTAYVGGRFDSADGAARKDLAAFDTETGAALPWAPTPGHSNPDYQAVNALLAGEDSIYVGGTFTTMNGIPRGGLASVDEVTGETRSWNPNAQKPEPANPLPIGPRAYAFARSGSTLYVGGVFDQIGGQSRNGLAALDTTTAQATAWAPVLTPGAGGYADASVASLALGDNSIFVAGNFSTVGGQPRAGAAEIDPATGLARPWNPTATATYNPLLEKLWVSGSTVYLSGEFNALGGRPSDGFGFFSDPAAPTPASPSLIGAAPAISGTAEVGQRLTASSGLWGGSPTLHFGYQWQRCDNAGSTCQDIAGARNRTIVLAAADAARRIRVVVIAANDYGSEQAASSPTGTVAGGSPSLEPPISTDPQPNASPPPNLPAGSAGTLPPKLTVSRARAAVSAALKKKFKKVWLKAKKKSIACRVKGTTAKCSIAFRSGGRRYSGTASVTGTRVTVVVKKRR